MRYYLFILLAFAALAPPLGAQGIEVTIDRPEATIQDQLLLTVTVKGAQRAVPQMPDLSDFQVYDRGQSFQTQMVNGQTSVSVSQNYILVPRRKGTFAIGAASVEIDGKVYKSKPFQVRILDAEAQVGDSDAVFLTATVSDDNPYVGQQVIFTWRFFRRVQIADAQLLSMDFEGFLVEDLGEDQGRGAVREYQTTRNGQRYLVNEIRKALFPQETGTVVIPASQLQCQTVVQDRRRRRSVFDVFGSQRTETKILRSPELTLNVRALPAAPADYSGLVGEFKLRSEISKRELKAGESATWKLTVSGTGNVSMIGEPTLPELPQFKVYDDKPASSVNRAGNELSGWRSYSKAIVPLEPGALTLPAVTLTYFDPQAGSYRKTSTRPVVLDVSPADDKEELRLTESVAPSTGKVAVRILADDILPIHKDLQAVGPAPFGHRVNALWLGAALAPPLLYFALFFVERRRRHFAANVGLLRHKGAMKKAMKELAGVQGASGVAEAAPAASRVLREYVGDKANQEGRALTPAEAEEHLRGCGVDEELAGRTRRLLEDLEAAQYGGLAGEDVAGIDDKLRTLLKELERQIGRPRS